MINFENVIKLMTLRWGKLSCILWWAQCNLKGPLKREVCRVIPLLSCLQGFYCILGSRQTSRAWTSPASGPLCLPCCSHTDLMGTSGSGLELILPPGHLLALFPS